MLIAMYGFGVDFYAMVDSESDADVDADGHDRGSW